MPPSVADKNYFELFGLPVSFDLDLADLTERYRGLARATHPDRFAGGSDQERRIAMQTTASINEAFRILKDPIARGRYLLELRGVRLNAESETVRNPSFLAEQIELRERLEDVRDAAGAKLLADDVDRRVQDTLAALREKLAHSENGKAHSLLLELQFLEKLRHQIHELDERFA
jgi:molecular chaperone HscB